MSTATTLIDQDKENSVLYLEFRKAIGWGWTIIGGLSIFAALTSQPSIKSWQVIYSVILLALIVASNVLDRLYESALFYSPVLLYLFSAPFFLKDPNQKPWISVGFIAVAAIFSLSNIENVVVSLTFSFIAVFLQQFIASKNLPSITDSHDLQLLNGYFGVTWCLLIIFGLLYIRQGYIKYHDSIELQLNKLYENQLVGNKNALAINTKDYRNLQLHGTVLNTLIYARDNLDLTSSSNRDRLADLIDKDISEISRDSDSDQSLKTKIKSVVASIGIRDLNVILNIDNHLTIDPKLSDQLLEIIREKVLNLKKHSQAQNCEITISQKRVKNSGISFIRPVQYQLFIEFRDDSNAYLPEIKDHAKKVANSRSLNRMLEPLRAAQSVRENGVQTIHNIQIPLIDFENNAVEKLFDLRYRSQEFVAKAYVLISMLFGAISLPAFIRVNVDSTVLILLTLIVIGSFISVFTPKFNFTVTLINAFLCLITFILAANSSESCSQLTYMPWLFNGLLGPIFFSVLVIPHRLIRWIPIGLFLIESFVVTSLLPTECKELLAGSTPGVIVLSVLAMVVLRIRRKRSIEDQELINSYEFESSEHEVTSKKLDDERNEIIENLKKYATLLRSNKTDLADPLKQIRFFILEIRALLVSAEYFNHQIVQAVYFKVKDRLRKDRLTELHIITDEFNDFDSDASIKELAKMDLDGYLNKDLKVAITKTDKTEVRFSDISNDKSQPQIIFEDKKVRLVRA
jgi:hypothetical protein